LSSGNWIMMITTEMIFEILFNWPNNHLTRLLAQNVLFKAHAPYTEDRNCLKESFVTFTPQKSTSGYAITKENIFGTRSTCTAFGEKTCKCRTHGRLVNNT
jgi:hypothetical protein